MVDANGQAIGKVDATNLDTAQGTHVYALVANVPTVLFARSDMFYGSPLYFQNPDCTGQAYIRMDAWTPPMWTPAAAYAAVDGAFDVYKADYVIPSIPYVRTLSQPTYPFGCTNVLMDISTYMTASKVGSINVRFPLRFVDSP